MSANLIVGDGTPMEHWRHSRRLAELPEIAVASLVPCNSRAVIIAPHPDDEVLGSGGLLQLISALGRPVLLLSITDGTASHPGSTRWPAEHLAQVRTRESAEALARLQLPEGRLQWLRGGFQDSQVALCESALSAYIEQHLRPSDVLFSTWREDGHSDHDAVGRASSQAARAVGASVHELPIWTWHWAHDDDPRVPWARARKIRLSAQHLARKRHAARAFTSQLQVDPSTGSAPVLAPLALERLCQPFEVIFIQG